MSKQYPIKYLNDNRAMINLGCGFKMNRSWNNVDFSQYAFLAHHTSLSKFLKRIGILSSERYERLLEVDPQIVRHDLRKGIPYSVNSFDVVYHSHVLEHIDRDAAASFLKECYRVLKSGGTMRVVIPDLRILVENYDSTFEELMANAKDKINIEKHLQSINEIFDQMVRKLPAGMEQQKGMVKFLERLLRGDAEKSGEIHRWMYDKYSLAHLLESIGFKDIEQCTDNSSSIIGWNQFNLDLNQDGSPYQPHSLYMEAVK